jgi:putative transposase
MEHASRRIIHSNVTAHPTAAWTLQQFREAIPSEHIYRFIIHDPDAIFSTRLDASLAHPGLEVIETPVRSPKANSLCEMLIGTLRRECLDWIIPLNEQHLQKTLRSWLPHYNRGRPHSSLGPGLPDPPSNSRVRLQHHRHRFDRPSRIASHSASIRPTKPHCVTLRPQRTSSRVQPPASHCMTVVEFMRSTLGEFLRRNPVGERPHSIHR